MARIESQPKVFLTQEEIETLNKTRNILCNIASYDSSGYVFIRCENDESEFWWVERFLENLVNISEVEYE